MVISIYRSLREGTCLEDFSIPVAMATMIVKWSINLDLTIYKNQCAMHSSSRKNKRTKTFWALALGTQRHDSLNGGPF